MTTYCQHARKLRLNRPGQPETVSERPYDEKQHVFTDGQAGTQVDVPADVVRFDVPYALRTGALAELPCAEHPGEAAPARSARKGDSDG